MSRLGVNALAILLLLAFVTWGSEFSVLFAITAVTVVAFEWMRGGWDENRI